MRFRGANILIDAGVGIRKVEAYLKPFGLSPLDIDAIFLTHEHTDHCRALKSFNKGRARVFANRLTAESVMCAEPETKRLEWSIFENGSEIRLFGVFQ